MSTANGTASTSPDLIVSSSSPSSPSSLSAASRQADSSTAPAPSSEPSATPSPTPSPSVNSPSSAAAPSSAPPSSAPASLPPSSSAAAPSSQAPSSNQPPSSSAAPATSVVTASAKPVSTAIITSVVTPSATAPGETPTPQTVVVTVTSAQSNSPNPTNGSPAASASATGTDPASLQNPTSSKATGGLNTGGKTAIAVVVPVVVVALLVLAGIVLWRKRKQRKNAEEARRKEVEEYGFNPNDDPTLPAVGMQSEMAEDQSGYRGWGNTQTSSNRKASTTLTSGMTYSDSNSNPGGYQSPGSPTHGTYSDGHSADPLMNGRRETMDSDGIGALGAAPAAGQNQTQSGVHRGPSNASSSYSAADRSDNSGDYPIPANNGHEYYENGYYQSSPYDQSGYNQQPIIRDVSARRNTRIENPSVFPQQGNSGIAQNF